MEIDEAMKDMFKEDVYDDYRMCSHNLTFEKRTKVTVSIRELCDFWEAGVSNGLEKAKEETK